MATARREIAQHYPQPGWVEHDPREIWTSQLAVAQEALRQAGATAADVAAIGITNQRETTVVWDRRTGEPIGPAIVWQDRRTAGACEQLSAQGASAVVQKKTGLVIDAYFSATKIAWLLDHHAGARARAEKGELAFGTIDTWLIWNLTGGKRHVTDPSNAARTSLLNLHTLTWDEALLALFRVPRALLPEVLPSSGAIADTSEALFGASLPIAGLAGDQQAATFGQACLQPGMAKNTYGTGLFLLMNTGAKPTVSRHKLLTTVGWQVPAGTSYALEGSVFMGGATVQWLRDGLGIIREAADIETLAAQCTDSGGVVLVPAFAGLGAPHWDPYARGTLIGLSRGTGRAQIARAALEAIALQTVDVIQAMEADSEINLKELRVDGGATRNNLLMQLQADLLGRPVVRPGSPRRPRSAPLTSRALPWDSGPARTRSPASGRWSAGLSPTFRPAIASNASSAGTKPSTGRATGNGPVPPRIETPRRSPRGMAAPPGCLTRDWPKNRRPAPRGPSDRLPARPRGAPSVRRAPSIRRGRG
jgi:glycerol kinase